MDLRKIPLALIVAFVAGVAVSSLAIGGLGLYFWLGRGDGAQRDSPAIDRGAAADVASDAVAPPPADPRSGLGAPAAAKETPIAAPRPKEAPPAAPSTAAPPPADPSAAAPPAPKSPPKSKQGSVLGKAGDLDRLTAPAKFPAGMLAFLRGLDQLGANHPLDAAESFGQAIAADAENSEYYAARGAALVVAEKMGQGLPDLERAMKLNPQNALASRMARLAHLMLGEQLKASKFVGHGSTEKVDFLITEVGVGYGSRALAAKRGAPQAPQDQQRTDAAIQKLPTVAALVARSFQTDGQQSAQAVFALGVEQFGARDFAAARRSFELALAADPQDWSSRYYYARSVLETGDPELARRELTYLLGWSRFLPEAFAARALCAARQHDLARAETDLATLQELAPSQAGEVEAAIAAAKASPVPAATQRDAAAQWDALLASAKAPRSPALFEKLTAAALALRRAVDSHRLRWDETYQDRLHALCVAVRAAPTSADRRADIAEFLRENNQVSSLQVAPGGASHDFRQQTKETAQAEIELALALAEEGLAIDPRHARSFAIKSAILLHTYRKLAEAEQAALAAVRSDPRSIAGHMALSDCFKEQAVRLREQAAALRTPKIVHRPVRVVDRNGVFVRNDTEAVTIPPTPEQFAQAEECDRQAAANEQQEQQALAAALAAAEGTKDEPYYQALMRFLKKDYAAARPWLEMAIAAKPQDPKLRHALANCLRRLGLEDEALEETSRAINLQQTTGEVWLRVAWEKLEHNAYDSARKALLRARELNPSDARALAYWGIAAEFSAKNTAEFGAKNTAVPGAKDTPVPGAKDTPVPGAKDTAVPGAKETTVPGAKNTIEAGAAYLAALAQEEARARANQTTFLADKDHGSDQPLGPEELGLSMLLRMKAARLIFAAEPARAAELYLATAANEPRMSAWNLAGVVRCAMLPYPDRDAKTPANPPPLVAVLKNNRVLCGQSLLGAGRDAEAAEQFAAAENFANRLPAGGTAYLDFELEPQYYPFRVSSMPIYVKLLNAQSLVGQGKRDAARLELQKVRYYLANRTSAQRELPDDPIPGLYARLAPMVGLK